MHWEMDKQRVAAMFPRNFEQKKNNNTRVLVINLVKISKDFLFLIAIFLKITETRFGLDPVCYF